MRKTLLGAMKPVARKVLTRIGQRLNVMIGMALMRISTQNSTRISKAAHQLLLGLGYGDHCYLSCLQTEAQCLRAEEKYGAPGRLWAGVNMPIARMGTFQLRQAVLMPLRTAIRPLRRWQTRQQHAVDGVKAGLFQGLGYRYRAKADTSTHAPTAMAELTAQAGALLTTYAAIAGSRRGQGSIGILISCFKPEQYLPGFLNNLRSLASTQRLVPVFINAGMSETCAQTIKSFLNNGAFSGSHFLERPGCDIYHAWNEGIRALGNSVEFITNFNVDDRRHPLCLEIQAEYLNTFAKKQVAVTDYTYFFEEASDISELFARNTLNRTMVPVINQRTLVDRNLPHAGPLWRRSLHEAGDCGLFDESYTSAGDAEFWYRVSRIHPDAFGVISLPLNLYFQNPTGLSTRPKTTGLAEHQRCSKTHYLHLIDQIDHLISPSFCRQYIQVGAPEEMQIHALAERLRQT